MLIDRSQIGTLEEGELGKDSNWIQLGMYVTKTVVDIF